MNILSCDTQKLFGLFELDESGTVLYSRVESNGHSDGAAATASAAPAYVGRNYFTEVATFKNVEEFRRRVTKFINSHGQADSFHFTCRFDGGPLLVRVLLARIRERSNGNPRRSILVHIRKA